MSSCGFATCENSEIYSQMPSNVERALIVSYWFRVMVDRDISIKDILKITLKFASEYEILTSDHKLIAIENDGKLVSKIEDDLVENPMHWDLSLHLLRIRIIGD